MVWTFVDFIVLRDCECVIRPEDVQVYLREMKVANIHTLSASDVNRRVQCTINIEFLYIEIWWYTTQASCIDLEVRKYSFASTFFVLGKVSQFKTY